MLGSFKDKGAQRKYIEELNKKRDKLKSKIDDYCGLQRRSKINCLSALHGGWLKETLSPFGLYYY